MANAHDANVVIQTVSPRFNERLGTEFKACGTCGASYAYLLTVGRMTGNLFQVTHYESKCIDCGTVTRLDSNLQIIPLVEPIKQVQVLSKKEKKEKDA